MRRLLPLALALLVSCTKTADTVPAVRQIRAPLPTLSGPTLQGGSVSPAGYRGKVVVVNFWATWCGPCRREQPVLEAAWERYRDRGVVFLGVNYRDDPAAARAYLREFGVTYPSLQDQAGTYAGEFGFVGLPDTYVVDRSGTMRSWAFGAVDEQELDRMITGVLGS